MTRYRTAVAYLEKHELLAHGLFVRDAFPAQRKCGKQYSGLLDVKNGKNDETIVTIFYQPREAVLPGRPAGARGAPEVLFNELHHDMRAAW